MIRSGVFRRHLANVFGLLAVGSATSQGIAAERSNPAIQLQWRAESESSIAGQIVVDAQGISRDILDQMARSHWTLSQWQALYAIRVEPGNETMPPMAGSYQISNGVIRFTPAFPLTPGLTYRATLQSGALPGGHPGEILTATQRVAAIAKQPSTIVTAIYPSASVLPENLLKFYLHFSSPMRRGHSYDHLELRDGSGKIVELPFLEIDEELWDPAMTRLTVFLDPGRIKRGVQPLEEVGPSLRQGNQYTLIVRRSWQDSNGHPLQQSLSKTFSVSAPDRAPLDPATWNVTPPTGNDRAPLEIHFPKALDHALAERVFRVSTGTGKTILGQVDLQNEERTWRFLPNQPWIPGRYQIHVATILEDLAGNNIGKPFDLDLFDHVDRQVPNSATIQIEFRVP